MTIIIYYIIPLLRNVVSKIFDFIKSYGRDAISIITLIILIYSAFYAQPIANENLQMGLFQIAENTYSPKPNLYVSSQCYILTENDVNNFFSDNYSDNYYADVLTLEVSNTYAENPWINVQLPEELEYINIKSIPDGKHKIRDETNNKQNTISITWDTNIPPNEDVKLIILYDKKYLNILNTEQRGYSFGSKEITYSYNRYFDCDRDVKIFDGFN